jgi:hypothetical protein
MKKLKVFRNKKLLLGKVFFSLMMAGLPVLVAGPVLADETVSYQSTAITGVTGSSSISPDNITHDAQGNTYVVGEYAGTVTFDGPNGTNTYSTVSNAYDGYLTKYNANGSYAWTKFVHETTANDFITNTSVSVSSNGNIYITGQYTGTAVFDGPGGTHSSTNSQSLPSSFVEEYNSSGVYQWADWASNQANSQVNSVSIALDSSNNVYIAGQFVGTDNFNASGTANTQGGNYNNNGDGFLSKYSSSGVYDWTKFFDNTTGSGSNISDVVVDGNNNIYINGEFNETIGFDGIGGPAGDYLTDPGTAQSDGFLTKYDSNGNYLWTKINGNSSNSFVLPTAIAIDSNNNVDVTGEFDGSVAFDGAGGTDTQVAENGNTDGYVTQYNSSGVYNWTRSFDNSASGSTVQTYYIGVSSSGDIYVSGQAFGSVTFNRQNETDTFAFPSNGSVYVSEFDQSGNYVTTRDIYATGASTTYSGGLTITPGGNLYLEGLLFGTATLDGPNGTNTLTGATGGTSFLSNYKLATISSGLNGSSETAVTAPNTGDGQPTNKLSTYFLIISIIFISTATFLVRRKSKTPKIV